MTLTISLLESRRIEISSLTVVVLRTSTPPAGDVNNFCAHRSVRNEAEKLCLMGDGGRDHIVGNSPSEK